MKKEIRRLFVDELKYRLRQDIALIQVVVGPRQVGKTTGLKQLTAEWDGPFLMVSADEVMNPGEEWLRIQWRRALELGSGALLVIDEIQKVTDWSRVIKLLFDDDKHLLKVVLLGSASLKIQSGLSESLVGRFERTVVPHWSFLEMEEAFGWNLTDYVRYGGYPSASLLSDDFGRWKNFMLHSVILPVLNQDLLQIASVNKPALFRQCFELAMSYPAQEMSLQKLLGQLQESGNVSTIKHYLELFEGAFLMRSLQRYSRSKQRIRASIPKLLPMTTALPQAIIGFEAILEEPDYYGRLFEVLVGSTLALMDGELYYWRERNKEVDFVFETQDALYAIEVKSHSGVDYSGIQAFQKHYPDAIPVIINQRNIEVFLREGRLL